VKQQGVTLIQMMFALALAGVLTQLAAPAYNAISKDLQRATAARELAQALRSARGQALLLQQAVAVQPLQGDWGMGWRVLRVHSGELLREQRLGTHLKIVGSLGNEVRFSAQGIPLRGNGGFLGGTLEVCGQPGDAERRQVVMAPSGRVSLRTDAAARPLCAGS
jgi:type IV fimbrial biogenesis protein FimT